MKKVLSMLLCLMLLALALVSCGDDPGTKVQADRPNLTLRMAIVVDDKTTDEGVAAMQKAFNDQCEVLLSTHIEFECIKASEYKARMTEIMNEVVDEKGKQNAGKEDAMANAGSDTGTELEDDENKYPTASKAQFDILLIADEEMYEEFVANKWLVGLSSHLKGNFKVLNTKMLTTAKDILAVDGEFYGVPANQAYGKYEYVVINKAAADFYNVEVNDIRSLSDAYQLIAMMETASAGNGLSKWTGMYGSDFSVIGATEADFVLPNVQYLSQDLKAESLFGATFDYQAAITSVPNARNLLKDDTYARYLTMKFAAKKAGYFSADGSETNFLIGLAEGDYALRYSNEDYYYVPINYPIFEKEELFGGMLAVSKFSVNEKRALEIVQELMTDATRANLLNIALFGDSQTNYYMEDGCVVYRNQSQYGVADGYLFGNLRELAYPCASLGQKSDAYTYTGNQNADLAQRQHLFDDDFSAYFAKIDAEKWKAFDTYCTLKYSELMASADMVAFEAKLADLIVEMDANEEFATLAQQIVNRDNWDYTTLGGSFYKYKLDRESGITGKPNINGTEVVE